jgi:hypothetical protein
MMNNKNDKLKTYLLGGNDKLIGSIIAFKRYLVKTNFDKWLEIKTNNKHINVDESKDVDIDDYKLKLKYLPEGYAILLYFDHRTGQIERHLYNPNLIFFNRKPLVNDYNKQMIQSKSTKYVNPYVFNYDPNRLFTPLLGSMLLSNIDIHNPIEYYKYLSEFDKFRDRPLIEIDDK